MEWVGAVVGEEPLDSCIGLDTAGYQKRTAKSATYGIILYLQWWDLLVRIPDG